MRGYLQRFLAGLGIVKNAPDQEVDRSSEPKTVEEAMRDLRETDNRLMENVRKAGDKARTAMDDRLKRQQQDIERMRAISTGECPECGDAGTVLSMGTSKTCPACGGNGKLID